MAAVRDAALAAGHAHAHGVRAPAAAVCSAIQRAQTLGFDVWSRRAWAPGFHPEMRPYRGTPGMEAFFTQDAAAASR